MWETVKIIQTQHILKEKFLKRQNKKSNNPMLYPFPSLILRDVFMT